MHEVDLTKCLLLSLQQWKAQHEPHTPVVEVVHLDVGDFTCVEPEALVFTWGALVKDGWLDGSRLEVTRIPLVARCCGCRATYAPLAEAAYRSPCCDHPMEEILSGRELRIRSVDYHLPPTAPAATAAVAAVPLAV